MEVRKIPNLNHDKKKRVAAYCRVSTNKDEQEESYERQVSYYENFIRSNPQWEFAGIYADKGHSGTSVRHRPEFQRLMSDALGKAWGNGKTKTAKQSQSEDASSTQERKIDIILVKSISRFARNLVDCDRAIKELKAAGVEVRFEKEHIQEALDAGCGFDAPGSFAAWLSKQTVMHAFKMPAKRYDIGDLKSYEYAKELFKDR